MHLNNKTLSGIVIDKLFGRMKRIKHIDKNIKIKFMEPNRLKQIHELGQSIWLDFIDRKLMESGKLKQLIDVDGVRGLTSNPAIFEKAISSSNDYNEDIKKGVVEGKNSEDIFYSLAITDIKKAADMLLPVYDEKVEGADGFVSLEVSPNLARDTQGTIDQALTLWKAAACKNLMIKIPGTAEGLAAIRTCISEGLNINVTLLFGSKRYREVADAYISGLEDRAAAGKPIDKIASVASFFLSRIDIMVDPMLDEKQLGDIKGEVAIACAKDAYRIYKEIFGSDRFKVLAEKGASPQRLLWASTSNKNPAFKDTRYVEALIGPKTVNTIPMETLDAFRDHGIAKATLEEGTETASKILEQLKYVGIDIEDIAQKLENEGLEKFKVPYEKMLQAIEKQKQSA